MSTKIAPLIIKKDDFDIIRDSLKTGTGNSFDKQNIMELKAELEKATLVDREQFPEDVVGLNTKVKVRDLETGRVLSITIVTPAHADIKQHKISVLAPIGTALLGFRKGQQVSWQAPSGAKRLMILDVMNPTS